MKEAEPFWEKAQLEMEATLGGDSITGILSAFKKITG
jgi:hypothetical protein